MKCNKTEDQLADYLLNILHQEDRDKLEIHLGSCLKCQQKLERFKKAWILLEEWEPVISPSALGEIRQKVIENIKAQNLIEEKSFKGSSYITAEREKTKTVIPKTSPGSLLRTLINYKITTFASAAVIIVAIVLGVNFIVKLSAPRVAWGKLAERIEKIGCYTFKMRETTTYTHGPVIKEESDVYYSSKYGCLMDLNWKELGLNIKIYNSFSDKTSTAVYPRAKKYTRIILREEQVAKVRDYLNDPNHLFRKIISCSYKELGSRIIDGKKVEGIEINDSRFGKGVVESCVGRLWVDVETGLPVLFETRAIAGDGTIQITLVIESFKWDPELDVYTFEPDLSDYTLAAEVVSQPLNEETVVQMLRSFSEMSGGKYPGSLHWVNCRGEFERIYRTRKINQSGLQRGLFFWEEDNFEWESFAKLNMQIHQTCVLFYGQLIKKGKNVAYYGKIVTAEDTKAPLMRWRISDDIYRVIFGNLSIQDVNVEELAKLEGDLDKLQFLHFPTPDLSSKPSLPVFTWERVVERLEKIDKYTFIKRETTTSGRFVNETSDKYYSSGHGCLMDLDWNERGLNIKEYNSFSGNSSTVVYPLIKKYYRIIASEEEVARACDLLGLIVKELTSLNYNKLGSKVIDGKRVEGIKVNDPKYRKGMVESCAARIWVDVDTDLPVLYEARATVGNGTIQIEQVIDSFIWDPDLGAHLFEPDLSDYTLAAEVVSQPLNEETAVQALRSFSVIASGKYPASLAWTNCEKEIRRIYRTRKIKEIGLQRALFFWEEDDFEWESFAKLKMQLRQTCVQFYGQLIKKGKNVAYYGKIVTADDMHAPLMRWKISDDEYRVLFGDLSIKDVSGEKLAEYEAELDKLHFLNFPTPKS
jgi:hypothetical protein